MIYCAKAVFLVLATAVPTHALADWSGAYTGLLVGSSITNELSVEEDGGFANYQPDSGTTFSAFAGYNAQDDDFVFGGEFAFLIVPDTRLGIDGEEFSLDFDAFDMKGRVGYAFNNILFYGVAGVSRIYAAEARANGFNLGVGADYDLENNIVFGMEYLARRAAGEAGAVDDVGFDALVLRAALRF
ncbi:outer membrane beta-barrel protein [Roseobacter sp. HKCCD9010]|uniref:outer membrane protein n=1 Tax=unclassified Roseobacter TaxID=196798 RepID=UPI0014910532|nr:MULTISPECIES: outer membrane beta-barrel protein [unclassified Roseobacter]MBF9052229.1 outer membrane beta-barrel protein [Rhodobacterales bacterium HKCCD4356]NNV14311.1 outer membrane beta-barrel protein [Roseobacter sp. HKCCD7357]NNV18349.1 outer membrane beta-barrel protein [Roseobacter sp. HKCCD8768]NNV27944.1 outer membrane beta-barrel protein [Roseobacter sp. HKCCD8192]NNV32123.1 outer membrane beta-barrel protein [Roseobacter sp. HKCCD9061]